MKILMVVHLYHPRHRKGVENYTFSLVTELRRAGQDVTVLTTEDRPSHENYSIHRKEVEGQPVIELVNNKVFKNFSETYKNPTVERLFQEILQEERPDVVHFQHLLFFSVDLVSVAKAAGCKTVYTLHEFWLQCLRFGHRLLPDGSLCREVTEENCAKCLTHTRLYNTRASGLAMGLLRFIRTWTGLDLHPLVRGIRVRMQQRGKVSNSRPDTGVLPDPSREAVEEVRRRNAHILSQLGEMNIFVAPSRFLRNELVSFGLPGPRVVVSDYGFASTGAKTQERPLQPGKLRLAFVGNLQRHKGLHVAVEAFSRIKDSGVTLAVHGNPEHDPGYVRELSSLDPRVDFRGEFKPDERARVLDEIDVLVFPSIWYENSPLTIHEAHLAGIPVVTSNLGGMAELVQHGVNGLLFPPGDVGALAGRLSSLLADPELVRKLSVGAKATRVKTVSEDAAELVSYYEALLVGRSVS